MKPSLLSSCTWVCSADTREGQETNESVIEYKLSLQHRTSDSSSQSPTVPDTQQSTQSPTVPDTQQSSQSPTVPDTQQSSQSPTVPDTQQSSQSPTVPDTQQFRKQRGRFGGGARSFCGSLIKGDTNLFWQINSFHCRDATRKVPVKVRNLNSLVLFVFFFALAYERVFTELVGDLSPVNHKGSYQGWGFSSKCTVLKVVLSKDHKIFAGVWMHYSARKFYRLGQRRGWAGWIVNS